MAFTDLCHFLCDSEMLSIRWSVIYYSHSLFYSACYKPRHTWGETTLNAGSAYTRLGCQHAYGVVEVFVVLCFIADCSALEVGVGVVRGSIPLVVV